jgi:hypothetical protein
MSIPKTPPDVAEAAPANGAHAPRPLTFAQNVVLTFKLLAGMGLLGAVLWAASLWTAARYPARGRSGPASQLRSYGKQVWALHPISS